MDSSKSNAVIDAQALFGEAQSHHRAGRLADADRIYRQLLSLKPDSSVEHYNLGCLLMDRKRFEEASVYFERAIALRPQFSAAYVNLGNALKHRKLLDAALEQYERVLIIDPSNADAHYNLATVLKELGKYEDAIEHYRSALATRPEHPTAHNNLGVLLQERGDYAAAVEHFRSAARHRPDYAEAHVHEAMISFLLGDFAAAWPKYEWRWRVKGMRPFVSTKPLWDGSDLQGKTILLRGEQGLGDCLQFIRYAAMVKAKGAKIILSCPAPLIRLFEGMNLFEHVIYDGDNLPDYDCHAPLMSLPMIFGTRLETIPNNVPYLSPPKNEVEAWANTFSESPEKKIGLVWAGNSRPNHPAANAVDKRRSMNLDQFAPLSEIQNVRFFSLQKGDPANQLQSSTLAVTDFMNDVQDFADTAAFIANLDLIIGVDTSVVHLAGAMGKPVWALSRFDGCWRWLLDRDDSPWYPTLRLFRQPAMGDWPSVVAKLREALAEFARA